jgi:hypothetical protein
VVSSPKLLAAILVVRTARNYFLQKENERNQAGSKCAGWDTEALLAHPSQREATNLGREG